MVEIGTTIRASITRIEPYGIFLDYEGESVFVDAGNYCWTADTNPADTFECGTTIQVFVLRYNYQERTIAASIKHLHPETNPYRILSRLPPDTEFKAKVQYIHKDCISVLLPNHAVGIIPTSKLIESYRAGDDIQVRITALEVDMGELYLEPT